MRVGRTRCASRPRPSFAPAGRAEHSSWPPGGSGRSPRCRQRSGTSPAVGGSTHTCRASSPPASPRATRSPSGRGTPRRRWSSVAGPGATAGRRMRTRRAPRLAAGRSDRGDAVARAGTDLMDLGEARSARDRAADQPGEHRHGLLRLWRGSTPPRPLRPARGVRAGQPGRGPCAPSARSGLPAPREPAAKWCRSRRD